MTVLATTINKPMWVDEFRKYTRGVYSLEACQSIFDDLISWQEKAGEIWVKNLTSYDVQMIYTEYETLEEFIEDYQLEGVKTIEEINNLDSMIRDFKEVIPITDTGRILVSDFSNH
tara:strand:- start:154 stop:501 length:348 start_codon:yes stop_codon:yes gene_type:complete